MPVLIQRNFLCAHCLTLSVIPVVYYIISDQLFRMHILMLIFLSFTGYKFHPHA
jgi:hypothetical protein